MKQTAIEWLQEQLKDVKYNPLEKNGYSNALERLYEQAKEMEKQQIIDAFTVGNRKLMSNDWLNGAEFGAKWQQEQDKKMYSEEEVELIANEMVNWAIDNIGNPNPQSGKKFDEVLNKYKK
jgi:hypothetical protein